MPAPYRAAGSIAIRDGGSLLPTGWMPPGMLLIYLCHILCIRVIKRIPKTIKREALIKR